MAVPLTVASVCARRRAVTVLRRDLWQMDHEAEVLAVHHGCKQAQIVGKCGNVGADLLASCAHPVFKAL